jgi:hypothetical protein
MIYGYGSKEINEYGLLEMKEITFSAPPSVLRQIAQFLEDTARQMEEGAFAKTSHRHIGSVIVGWDKRFPNKDIIVMPPSPQADDLASPSA